MTTYMPGASPQNRNPQFIGFPLLGNFTLISLVSAAEPLRVINQFSGRELYRWHMLNLDGRQVWASDGLQTAPGAGTDDAPAVGCVIVRDGTGIQHNVTREHVTFLRTRARQSRRLSTMRTDSWTLARTGLLDGYDCSVHWECLAAMQKALPRVAINARLFSTDRNCFTSSGGTVPMDTMLHLIGREHGHELSATVSEMFIYEHVRSEQDHQRVPLRHMFDTNQPKLQRIVALMEANLEEPIDLDELAVYANVSRRQLERLFQKYLHCSPSRYYPKLRLIRTHQLLKQASMSIIKMASVCGFVSTPHFPKCCREYFGISPRDERQGRLLSQPVVLMSIPQDLALMSNSSALSVLSRAQGELTFTSVRI